MDNKLERIPIIDPLLLALKSRRVLVALSALLVGLLLLAVPELEAIRTELLTLVISLALAVIGGYSVEDAARAARQSDISPDLREQLKEIIIAVFDEVTEQEQGQITPTQ